MDPYAGFAERYDLSFGAFGDNDAQVLEFFRQLFTMYSVHNVLDCACGTGRHLPLFHSLGCEIVGSDVSTSMLEQAHINLVNLDLEIPLYQVDFRKLPDQFPQPFDAILCLGAIGFMPDDQEITVAFTSMYDVLRPGGILVLTAIPTDRQWTEKMRFKLIANTHEFSRVFVIDYFERTARFNILDIFHGPDNEGMKVWSADLTVLLQDKQEFLLKKIGYREINFYGEFDFSIYHKETSHNLITVAKK